MQAITARHASAAMTSGPWRGDGIGPALRLTQTTLRSRARGRSSVRGGAHCRRALSQPQSLTCAVAALALAQTGSASAALPLLPSLALAQAAITRAALPLLPALPTAQAGPASAALLLPPLAVASAEPLASAAAVSPTLAKRSGGEDRQTDQRCRENTCRFHGTSLLYQLNGRAARSLWRADARPCLAPAANSRTMRP